MNIETRLTKLEKYLSISNQKQPPSYVCFTVDEWEVLHNEQASQEEKDQILASHNLKSLYQPVKMYVGASPDDWDLPNDLKTYVGIDIDRV